MQKICNDPHLQNELTRENWAYGRFHAETIIKFHFKSHLTLCMQVWMCGAAPYIWPSGELFLEYIIGLVSKHM